MSDDLSEYTHLEMREACRNNYNASRASEIDRLRAVLRELIAAASIVEGSTDRSHWERLDRAIERAEDAMSANATNRT